MFDERVRAGTLRSLPKRAGSNWESIGRVRLMPTMRARLTRDKTPYWPDRTVEEANLRVHIATLWKALGDGREGVRYIVTVPSRGYCLSCRCNSPRRSPRRREKPLSPIGLQRLPQN